MTTALTPTQHETLRLAAQHGRICIYANGKRFSTRVVEGHVVASMPRKSLNVMLKSGWIWPSTIPEPGTWYQLTAKGDRVLAAAEMRPS